MSGTERTQVRRKAERGSLDTELIYSILDEALYCHVGFVDEGGYPVVIPTIHARDGDTLYLHGSPASHMLRTLAKGAEVCVTVTLLDALVLARSVFHHSMNYRSVMVFGTPRMVEGDEKATALQAVTNHAVPGRWDDARQPNESEFKATTVIAVSLDEASAKVRKGPVGDEEEDYALPIWAGLIPVAPVFGEPLPDERLHPGLETPSYAKDYRRPHSS